VTTRTRLPRLARFVSLGLLGVVLVGAAAVLAPHAASAKDWDSEKDNVFVSIPESPAPWEWLDFTADWTKHGIVKGASRVLTRLKGSDKEPDGQGALMHLAVRDAPAGKTLEQVAADAEIRSFLLARFQGSEGDVQSEEVKVDSGSDPEGHPAIVLRATGKANNLKAKPGRLCTGYLLIALARGKLYLLRMYAFPADEQDLDGLVYDLDFLEANCLRISNTKDEAAKEGPPKKDEGAEEKKDDGAADEPERKDEVIENRAQRWRITIDKKLKPIEITDDERKDFLEIKCVDADQHGGYSFYVYAPPTIQYTDGVQGQPPDLVKWITSDWWADFVVNHPKGDLITYEWPRRPFTKGAKTFLTLPDFDDEKARRVVIADGKDRPIEVDAADMFKKLGFCEKVKDDQIGKKGKVSEAVRGIMSGRRPRLPGFETIVRFAWRGRAHSYRVFVSFWGEAHKKWGEALRNTLESWEFGLKFKD